MFRYLRKHRTVLLVTLAAVIIGLPFFGIGGNLFVSSPHDAVLRINGEKITRADYNRLYNQLSRQQENLTPDQRKQLPRQVLDELVRQEVFSQEAEKYGIFVPDNVIRVELQSQPAFQTEGRFDPQKYGQFLGQVVRMSPADFEKNHGRDISARNLNQIIAASVHVSDEKLQSEINKRKWTENPEKLRAELRNEEINDVFQDWLSQLNANIRYEVVSEDFLKQLSNPS